MRAAQPPHDFLKQFLYWLRAFAMRVLGAVVAITGHAVGTEINVRIAELLSVYPGFSIVVRSGRYEFFQLLVGCACNETVLVATRV